MSRRRRIISAGLVLSAYMRLFRLAEKIGVVSSVFLALLGLATIAPLYNVTGTESAEAVVGTSQNSTLTFSATRTTASVSLGTSKDNSVFGSSSNDQKISFSIITNNYTGYNLGISSPSGATTLTNPASEDVLNSISTSLTESEFSSYATNNVWGYKPNYYNNAENTDYLPAPTTATTTLRETSSANSSSPDTYEISLGAKADYNVASGTYSSNALVLTYVANPVTYAITYDKGNTTDTVSNLPGIQSGAISASSVNLSSAIPTRSGYDFIGWCLGSISTDPTTKLDSCVNDTTNNIVAKTFKPGDPFGIDQTITNNATLHAMWMVETIVTITVQDGGNTTVSGSGTYKYGDVITVTATPTSNTTCETYDTPTWTAIQTVDNSQNGTGTLSSTSGTSITYTVGLTDDTLIAESTKTDVAQTVTLTRKTGANGIKIDGVKKTGSSVSLSCGDHTIEGVYNSGYDFDSWYRTNGVTFASGTSDSAPIGTITVTGSGKLTLYTKSCIAISGNMQSFSPTAGTCSYGTLTDSRDSKTYTVREINGQWWMTQNLRFTGTSLSTSTSNVTSSKTLTYYNLDKTDSSYTSHCDSTNSYNYACIKDSGSTATGVWYNYYAASASTISGSSNSNAVSQDICPKNWRLPTGPSTTSNTDFNKLIDNTTSGWQNPTTGLRLFGAVDGGSYYGSGSVSKTEYGLWWSSTSYSTTQRHTLYYGSNNEQFYGDDYSNRNSGRFIRCVFKDRALSNITKMQEATPSVVNNTAEGATRTLTDSRDSKTYTVKKINGQLWMTQNLRFTETSLNSTTSNTTSNKTLTYYSLASTDSSYDGHCNSKGYSYACIKDSGSTTTGVWYNFYAASAGTVSGSSNSNDATQDICPKGWRLPTGSNTTSGTDLNKLVGNTNSGWQATTSGLTAFGAVTGGQYSNGINDNSSYELNTKSGYWWSATASSPYYRYHLSYNSSDRKFNSNIVGDRYYGNFIRCVAGS